MPGLKKEIIPQSPFGETNLTVGEAFPDAHRMPIAARLREWGIDVRDIPLRGAFGDLGMTDIPYGRIYISMDIPDVHKYVVLSHELAHLLQGVEGRIDLSQGKWRNLHEWISLPHEADALRWEARQSKVMGISEEEFLGFTQGPGFSSIELEYRAVVHPVFTGEWPEEHGVRPMFPGGKPFVGLKEKRKRKPVRVTRHRRRR